MTLEIKHLSKQTDRVSFLKDISLNVETGEILGIFGTNEQNVSDLIQLIAGREQQESGKINFGGEDFSTPKLREREFYFPGKQMEKSIFGNVFKSSSTKKENPNLNIDEILENAKNVLILEKPFGLMERNKRIDRAEVFRKTVREKALSVIISSSNFEEVFSVCDRVAILHNGRIIQTGTPREVYEKPATAEVAGITGRNNLIKARRISSTKKETPEFQTIKGEHRLFTERVEKKDLGAINQNITLAIRPEHISISFGASFPADNLLKAEISDIKYLGATTLIKLNANGLILEALVLRLVGLNVGDECVVGLPPERILILKD